MVGNAYVASDASRIVLGRWINAPRRAGASWADIGETMGISRRAVQQRFGGELGAFDSGPGDAVITRQGMNAFNKIEALNEEGRKSHRPIGCGILKLYFEQTDSRWEHQRVTSAWLPQKTIDVMANQGWTHVTSWFPHHCFRREAGSL